MASALVLLVIALCSIKFASSFAPSHIRAAKWSSNLELSLLGVGVGVGEVGGLSLHNPWKESCSLFMAGAGAKARRRLGTALMAKPTGGGRVSRSSSRPPKAPRDDVIQVNGVVTESLPNAMFRVEIEPSKQVVLATVCGKIRKSFVRIMTGDSVECELSTYDLSRARIKYRTTLATNRGPPPPPKRYK